MEGYKVASQEQSYDEFDLESAGEIQDINNLEDEPVAKILLPSLNQKKPATIKINLQNPTFSKKSTVDIVQQKPSSPELVTENSSQSEPVLTFPVPQDKELPPKNISFPKFNVKAIDKEAELRRLFGQKFPTPEKPYGSLFIHENTRLGRRIACKACNIHCTSENDLICHANGKKHLTVLVEMEEKMANPDLKLAPGEPVPPGFEDEMKRVPMCQAALDDYQDSAVIGLEYLVELLAEDDDGRFICFLCDKKGESPQSNARQNMISHIIATSHRLAYIKKHFPSAHEAIQKTSNERERKTERGSLARLVAANIESDFGRLPPAAVDKHMFELRKDSLREQIEGDKHFSETPEKTYVELINPPQEKSSHSKYEHRKTEERKDAHKRGPEEINPRKNSLNENFRKDGQSPTVEHKGKRRGSREDSDNEVTEILATKKKQRLDDPLKDTTPISLSSDELTLSSSSRSRSRSKSPGRASRHYNNRHNDRYNRPGYPENIIGRRERYDHNEHRNRHQTHRRRSRSPQRRRSRSPRYHRSKSPNFPRRHQISRSPKPFRNSNSPRPENFSLSPSRRSKSPSQARSQSSQDRRIGGPRKARPRQDNSPDEEKPLSMRDKWIKFREEADVIELEMQKQREYHQKNPEKHPLYGEEWKKFWNARYKEVQAMGKDPGKYDYKPEWVTYWNRKVVELLDIDFKNQKDALKKKYELIGEEEQPQYQSHNFKPRSRSMRGAQDDENYSYGGRDYNNRSGGSVSDVKDTWKALTGGEIHAPYTGPPREPTWVPPARRQQTYNQDPMPVRAPCIYDNREDSCSVVGVLRLLTALESQLGSFGPKVNTLLAEAISLEKKEIGSSDTLATKMENIVLFETVKEKFKGQLMAGIVEHFNQKAVRMAITDLTVLLAKAPPPQKAPTAAETVTSQTLSVTKPQPTAATPVEVPGVGAMDRTAIAMQIAEALMAQGRTDVSEAELEQLIDAVVGMAKQSAESNKPVSAASFVKQMESEEQSNKVASQGSGTVQEKSSSSALKALQTAYNRSPPKKPQDLSYTGFNLSNVAEIGDLAEADLKSCLRIFQHLSTNEQRSLVMYLKKLEDTNPQRVEKLRKYVNLGAGDVKEDEEDKKVETRSWDSRASSPFSSRAGGANPYMNESRHGDDSDEEYSFEDVYKAAARNVDASHQKAIEAAERKKQEEENKRKVLSKPADNNALKQVIEATTDNMIASLKDSRTERKDSPLRGNTMQNVSVGENKAPFVVASNRPPLPPPNQQRAPLHPSGANSAPRQQVPHNLHENNPNQTSFQDMGYNTTGYGDPNFIGQGVGYPGQQFVQYPTPQVPQYSSFGSEPFYQYQQPDAYAQQFVDQAQQMQQQMATQPQQSAYAQPDANSYHPAQYSASYEKRQQKMTNQPKRKW